MAGLGHAQAVEFLFLVTFDSSINTKLIHAHDNDSPLPLVQSDTYV